MKTQFSLWLNEIQHLLIEKSKYNLPHEYDLIPVRVWNNSGASIVSLRELFDLTNNLHVDLQNTDSESGNIIQIKNDIVYLYGLVVNSERIL